MDKELSTVDNAKETPRVIGKPFEVGNPGGGRPLGSKNVQTLFREAMTKIAEAQGITLIEVERNLAKLGVDKALGGDYKFYQDTMDRLHGKPVNRNENINANINVDKLPDEDKERLNSLLNE